MSEEINVNQGTVDNSLLGTAGTDRDPNKGTNTPTWFWTPEIRGEGAKPEYLLDKHKTVEDQARNYSELEKKLGAFTGAPKDGYDLSFIDEANKAVASKAGSDAFSAIDKESPAFTKFVETAKNLNISQDAMKSLLSLYVEDVQARIPDRNEEMKKLGNNAQEQLNILGQWASNNLSREEAVTLTNMITTAESAKLFMKLRELAREPKIPTNNGDPNVDTVESLQTQIKDNYHDYVNNKNGFREKIEARMRQVIEQE
jgi:hypothetical protein